MTTHEPAGGRGGACPLASPSPIDRLVELVAAHLDNNCGLLNISLVEARLLVAEADVQHARRQAEVASLRVELDDANEQARRWKATADEYDAELIDERINHSALRQELRVARGTAAGLVGALGRLLTAIDESEAGEPARIGAGSDAGCIECTSGTVPDALNTGLCAYHVAVALVEPERLDYVPRLPAWADGGLLRSLESIAEFATPETRERAEIAIRAIKASHCQAELRCEDATASRQPYAICGSSDKHTPAVGHEYTPADVHDHKFEAHPAPNPDDLSAATLQDALGEPGEVSR